MGMTQIQQNALLNAFFATERFMSLHTSNPDVNGSFAAEVSSLGTGYVRQSLAGKLVPASGGYVSNSVTVLFPAILADYGLISHFGISDAVSAGTMGLYGYFSEAARRGIGQQFQFPPGTLRFQFR